MAPPPKPPQQEIRDLLPSLMENPRVFVHSFDFEHDTALVLKVPEGFYRNAVFLDNRALKDIKTGAHVPLGVLLDVIRKSGAKPEPVNFIFHIGHSGSTLISRFLDTVKGVFGLREPLLFRMLAETKVAGTGPLDHGKKLRVAYLLLSRKFSPDQTTIIKTTSTCNCIAPELLSVNENNRALCLYTSLEQFLANMAMKDMPKDMYNFYPHCRAQILTHDPGLVIEENEVDLGKLIAVNWLGEILDLFALKKSPLASRCRFIDFDNFLDDPENSAAKLTRFFGLTLPDPNPIGEILSSYSKLPGFKYTPRDRALNLAESKQKSRNEIEAGLAFAATLAKKSPIISEALEFFPIRP